MSYRWTLGKDSQKLDKKFCEQSAINYVTVDYDVTVDRQKKSFIKPGKS